MTTMTTIATMATPMAERLNARVFGKRNASATRTKTTIHSIASIFIRTSTLRSSSRRCCCLVRMRRGNLRAHWLLAGTLLQPLNEPAARRTGWLGREIGGRHRQYQTLLRQILDRQLHESAFQKI